MFIRLNFLYVFFFLAKRLVEHMCYVYMGLWLDILRKSSYLMDICVEFEYDQFWPNQLKN